MTLGDVATLKPKCWSPQLVRWSLSSSHSQLSLVSRSLCCCVHALSLSLSPWPVYQQTHWTMTWVPEEGGWLVSTKQVILLKESVPMQVDKKSRVSEEERGSGALKEEIGVWNFQGGGKDKCLCCCCCFSLHSLVLFIKKRLFSLSLELMITQQTAQFKLCSFQALSHVRLFLNPWTAARQASLIVTNSQSSPKIKCIKLVMPSRHLIFCRPLHLLPPISPSIRDFSHESNLCMRWPKYWSFSFSIIPSKEIPGLISFRMDWLDLLAVQGTLQSLLQHLSSKASILWCSAFFTVQLSHPYMTTGKTIALTKWTFVGKVVSAF